MSFHIKHFSKIFIIFLPALLPAIIPQDLSAMIEVMEIHCKHIYMGFPLGTPAYNDLIVRDNYALSSNDTTKFADWVAYRLDKVTINGKPLKKRNWKADPWLDEKETLEPDDYDGAHKALHTDRGHQAPLASFKGSYSWETANYLSNITPQFSELNQGPWRILEELVRKIVQKKGLVYIMTGPLYQRPMPPLPGADEPHQVPSGYWKIVIIPEGDSVSVFGFIFQQETARSSKVEDHIVSVDEIENVSGLDFLHEMDSNTQQEIEAKVYREEWLELLKQIK